MSILRGVIMRTVTLDGAVTRTVSLTGVVGRFIPGGRLLNFGKSENSQYLGVI